MTTETRLLSERVFILYDILCKIPIRDNPSTKVGVARKNIKDIQ